MAGGAAEGGLTVLSDIDVLVVVEDPGVDKLDTVLKLRRRAEELGVPEDAPLDIKVLTRGELDEHRRRGLYRRLVEVAGGGGIHGSPAGTSAATATP